MTQKAETKTHTLDAYEREVLAAYEAGQLASAGGQADLDQARASARATGLGARQTDNRPAPLKPQSP